MKPGLTAPRLSVVVLPFSNLTGDAAQDYLGDVITEELTTSLSRIPHSFVIARSTAFTYKGKAVDVRQIGRDLGVRYILEGSQEQGGNRVRVNAQLIDADTGAHLWADQFDADRTDLLDMQDRIATQLSRALQIRLIEVDAARVARTHPGDADAEQLAMRCQAVLDDQFHETHPIGCHHSSLVNLACRSYILVIRSWSAYDSNHGKRPTSRRPPGQLSLLDQDDQAIGWLRRAVAAAPQWPLPQVLLAAALSLTGHEAASPSPRSSRATRTNQLCISTR